LDNSTRMLLYVIRQNGMTMGLDEVYVHGEAYDKIQRILKDANDEADKLIKAFNENDTKILRRAPGRSMRETLELRIRQVLAEARKMLNLGQMSAVVGQQAIRGERINRGYSSRTLPHFKVNDLTPQARGFVESSYRKGLNPEEFFFHAMGGREGLVDTAVRTSTSGYMQRRLVNALQDMIIENDGTVRNSDKNIIQFRYGDDGIDPMHTDHSDAVNLEVLLLKAKALDLNEIREEIKKSPKPKPAAKKPAAKKPATKKPAAKKTPAKKTPAKQPKKGEKALSEEELRELYNKETGKNAEWRGKLTKGYLDWKKEKSG
jgi:DNA-directed RNA polymerase subunit A'